KIMKRLRKKLLSLLVCAGICAAGGAITACDNDSAKTPAEKTQIEEVYATYVAYAEGNGDTPLSYEDWLNMIKGEKGEKGDTGAPGANGENGVTPHIGENGNWFIGDTDTGVKAAGANGENGVTPHIGENGNWFIGNTDTGVKAAGTNGTNGTNGEKGDKGDKGDPGQNGEDGRGIERIEIAYEYDNDGNEVMFFRVYYKGEDQPEIIPVAVPKKVSYIYYNGNTVFGVCGADEEKPVLTIKVVYEKGEVETVAVTDDMYVVDEYYQKPDFTTADYYNVKVKYKGQTEWFDIDVREDCYNYKFDETVVRSLDLSQNFVAIEPFDETGGYAYIRGTSVKYGVEGDVMFVSAADLEYDGGYILFTAENNTLSFYQPDEAGIIGTYKLNMGDVDGEGITVKVYAPYKTDGENVAVLSGKADGVAITLTTTAILTVDKENPENTRLAIGFLGAEFSIDEYGNLIYAGDIGGSDTPEDPETPEEPADPEAFQALKDGLFYGTIDAWTAITLKYEAAETDFGTEFDKLMTALEKTKTQAELDSWFKSDYVNFFTAIGERYANIEIVVTEYAARVSEFMQADWPQYKESASAAEKSAYENIVKSLAAATTEEEIDSIVQDYLSLTLNIYLFPESKEKVIQAAQDAWAKLSVETDVTAYNEKYNEIISAMQNAQDMDELMGYADAFGALIDEIQGGGAEDPELPEGNVIGVYTFDANAQSVIDNPSITQLILYDNGTVAVNGDIIEEYTEIAKNVIYVNECIFYLDDVNKTASFYVPADKELIGTYYTKDENPTVCFGVYGEYAGAGQYITVITIDMGDTVAYRTIYGMLDLEKKTITVYGETYSFDENNIIDVTLGNKPSAPDPELPEGNVIGVYTFDAN
ncbi:MAG: hypothetical protein ACI4SH_02860, partial [Candidatus Scatosoma sp.]